MEGKAENQDHEAGGSGERDSQRGIRDPGSERVCAGMQDCELAVGRIEASHAAIGKTAIRKWNFQNARGLPEGGEWLRRAEHINKFASDKIRLQRNGRNGAAVAIAACCVANGGDNDALLVCNQNLASCRARPGRKCALEL